MISLLLAIAVLSSSIVSQIDTCFNHDIDSMMVFVNDKIAVDLNGLAQGGGLKFSLKGPENASTYQPTFFDIKAGKKLEGVVQGCNQYIKLDDRAYAFLCDDNKVIIANLSIRSADLESQKLIQLDSTLKCFSLAKSSKKDSIYAACVSKESSNLKMTVSAISSLNFEVKSMEVTQTPEEYLSQNLKLEVVTLGNSTVGYSAKIYVVEDLPLTKRIKLRAIEHTTEGQTVDLGYFSVENQKLKGVSKDSLFYTVRADHNNFLLFVKGADPDTNFVHFCPAAKTTKDGVECFSAKNTRFSAINPAVSVHRYEEKDLLDIVFMVIANKTGVRLFEYKPTAEDIELLPSQHVYIEGSSLDKPSNTFMYDQDVYITGQASNGKTVIIKWDMSRSSWEEKILVNNTFGVYHIRRGTYDTDIDQFIGLEGGTFQLFQISKPLLVLRPYLLTDKDATNMTVNVSCESLDKKADTRSMVLTFQPRLNSNSSFKVPSALLAYSNSKKIQLPIEMEDFRGNAPEMSLTVNSTTATPYTIHYKRSLDKTFFLNDTINNIKDVFYMGEGMYLIESMADISAVACAALNDTVAVCMVEWTQEKKDDRVLDARIIGNLMLVLLTNAKTVIDRTKHEVNLLTVDFSGQEKISKRFQMKGISSAVGHIKQYGDSVFCMIYARVSIVSSESNQIYTSKYTLSTNTMDDPYVLMTLGKHVCGKSIKFVPKFKEKMYLASSCGVPEYAQIYEIELYTILRDNKAVLAGSVKRQFSGIESNNFEMCPTGSVLYVVSFDEAKVWGYDEQGSEFTRFEYPAKEYGVQTILDFYCDQENKVFQIIGVDKIGMNPLLITYRAETQYEPARRVHSVIKLPKLPTILSSSYNLEFDEISTLLFGTSTADISFYQLYTEAPMIELSGEKLQKGLYQVNTTVSYPDREGQTVTIESSTLLEVYDQLTEISVYPTKATKDKLPQHGTISLDNYLMYSGPVVRFDMPKTDAAILLDRLYPSDQFRRVKQRFEVIAIDQQFILAYANGTISLFNDADLVQVIATNREVDILRTLGPNTLGFVAVSRTRGAANFELLFVLNQGGTWKTYSHQIYSPELKGLVSFKIATDSIFYSFVDAEDQSIRSGLLKVAGDTLERIGIEDRLDNGHNVIVFDCVKLNQNASLDYVVILYSEDQSKNGKMVLYKLDNNSFSKVNTQVSPLLQGRGSHEIGYLACKQLKDKKDMFDCFHARPNMFSHNVLYRVDFDKAITSSSFIIEDYIYDVKNIVNFVPVRAAVMDKYVAVVLMNKNVDLNRNDTIFAEEYLMVVYNLEVQVDPYKILDYRELGLTKNEELMYLEPVFYNSGSDNRTKLAVNVAGDDVSIKTFNLEDMKLVVSNGNALSFDVIFTGLQIDGVKKNFKLSDLFILPQPPSPSPPSKGKNLAWLFILLIAAIVLFAVGLATFFLLKRREASEGAYVTDEQLRGGFDSEHTIKNDNTSVIPV